jgi:hypothetical protein
LAQAALVPCLIPIGPQPEKYRQAALRRICSYVIHEGGFWQVYSLDDAVAAATMARTMLLVILVLLGACSRTPDEQRIRESIEAMQKAAEERNPRAFLTFVSEDFIGNDAEFDKAALANLLRVEVFHGDKVGVTLGPIDIDVQDDRATAHVTATLTGGSGGLLPERGAIYDITSGWKRRGRDWVCYSGRWEQEP